MEHYTYLIEYDDGMLYHGVHSSIEPKSWSYLGSSAYTPEDNLVVSKTVLSYHPTREEANSAEKEYHKRLDVKNHKDYYNECNAFAIKSTLGMTKANNPSRAAQAAKLTGRDKLNDAGRAAQAAKLTGRTKHSHSGILAQSKKVSVMFLGEGNPMSNPKWQRTCSHCNKTMDKGNFTRYHGDKCKERK